MARSTGFSAAETLKDSGGNTVTSNGMRSDMIQLLPGMMMVSDMVPDDPGTWLFHCHVNDHIAAGMLSRYRVVS